MCLRWTAAGMLEAETRFRNVEGYRGLANLAVAIERDLTRRRRVSTTPEPRRTPRHSLCNHDNPGLPSPKFHDGRGNLQVSGSASHDPARLQASTRKAAISAWPTRLVLLVRSGHQPEMTAVGVKQQQCGAAAAVCRCAAYGA